MRYVVIEANGTFRSVETAGTIPLDQMQKIVGGYICSWSCEINGVHYNAFVNDEGLIMEPPLPSNAIFPQIAGAILIGHVNEDGDFLGLREGELPDLDIVRILRLARNDAEDESDENLEAASQIYDSLIEEAKRETPNEG